jgi:hypothetical protein
MGNEKSGFGKARGVCRRVSQAKFTEFKIQNIVGSCDVKFPIRLEKLAFAHGQASTHPAPPSRKLECCAACHARHLPILHPPSEDRPSRTRMLVGQGRAHRLAGGPGLHESSRPRRTGVASCRPG